MTGLQLCGGLRDGSARETQKHQTADAPPTPSIWIMLLMHALRDSCPSCYDGLTVKLMSRVNVLFAILSVTLISSR